jgi:hypothetical protein
VNSVREQVLEAIVATLNAGGGVGANVYRSRVTPVARGESPAVIVEPTQDTASQATTYKIDWGLTVSVTVLVRSETPDQTADPIVQKVHQKIMADLSLGGYSQDIQPQQVKFDFIEADVPTGIVTCDYLILYRTSLQDITMV